MRPALLTLSILLLTAASAGASRARQSSSPAAPATEPLSIAVIVDTSSSMRDSPAARHLGEALQRLVVSGDGRNEYFVFSVSTSANLDLQGSQSGIDAERAAKALKKIFAARKEGATALWDACVLAAVKLGNAKHQKRAILVVSDGGDTVSNVTPREALELLKRSGVRLSAVVIRPAIKEELIDQRAINTLKRMATESGGTFFELTKDAGKDSVFDGVGALVNP